MSALDTLAALLGAVRRPRQAPRFRCACCGAWRDRAPCVECDRRLLVAWLKSRGVPEGAATRAAARVHAERRRGA